MKLTDEQRKKFAEEFAKRDTDSADMKTLIRYYYDESYSYYMSLNREEMNEVINDHGEDVLEYWEEN